MEHNQEHFALSNLLADIRAAVGDPTGKLMQDELVERCKKLKRAEDVLKEWLEELMERKRIHEKVREKYRNNIVRYALHDGIIEEIEISIHTLKKSHE